jgi:hypothetical protein
LDFNSEVEFSFQLFRIEELFFKKLKDTGLDKIPDNQIKWNEFKNISFINFECSQRFEIEKNYFHNFIKKFCK